MSGPVKYLPSVFFCLVVLGISLPAAAQDVPMVELSGGYNYLRGKVPVYRGRDLPPTTFNTTSFANGWHVDLGINTPKPKKMLALVLQVSQNPKTIAGAEAGHRVIMLGLRLNNRAIQRTVLFGHLLGGNTNSKFGNAAKGFDEWTAFFTVQVGGGVSLMVTPKVGIRLGADFVQIHGKHDSTILNEGFNEIRIAAGIVLPFGTR